LFVILYHGNKQIDFSIQAITIAANRDPDVIDESRSGICADSSRLSVQRGAFVGYNHKIETLISK
jgi:hypothetical protein